MSDTPSASTETFLTSLVFNATVFGVGLTAFTFLRPRLKFLYEPRTYALPQELRIKPLSPDSIFLWPWRLYKKDYRDVLEANGMDAYAFVRLLRMMTRVFLPIWIISWIVLLPVTSVKSRVGDNSGLDRLVFGNVDTADQERYAAHLLCVYLFTGWIFYNIQTEMRDFILERQKYLTRRSHAKSVQANTILVTGVPAAYLSVNALKNLFGDLPGGVKKIWFNRNLKELPEVYEKRLKACDMLEEAEAALMKTAAKIRAEEIKRESSFKANNDVENQPSFSAGAVETEENAGVMLRVPKHQRPQHRLGLLPLPFVGGEKKDTVEWAREKINTYSEVLRKGRRVVEQEDEGNKSEFKEVKGESKGSKTRAENYPRHNSVFVTFHKQIAAHLAVQALLHHELYQMSGKKIEVSPEDVIWTNLNLTPAEKKVRTAIGYVIAAEVVIVWAVPMAFVGIITNIYSLCDSVSWLAWICALPRVVIGIISGVVPPLLFQVLMWPLPILLRYLAKFEGVPTHSGVELRVTDMSFGFEVIHSILVVTFSSGIIKVLPDFFDGTMSVTDFLAQNFPSSSIFFLTDFIYVGLSLVAKEFLQVPRLASYYYKIFVQGSTLREVLSFRYEMRSFHWGTTVPHVTSLVVVGIVYSVLSPVINGLACVAFFAIYQLYKYLFLYQLKQQDTGGLIFPKAIQHVFVGLYIQQISMATLFIIIGNTRGRATAIPEGVLMLVLVAITAGFHTIINSSYGPLLRALPLSLKDEMHSDPRPMHYRPNDEGNQESVQNDEQNAIAEHQAQDNAGQDAVNKVTEEEEYGFAHPAISRPQRPVWILKDELGLWKEEERACKEASVDVNVSSAGVWLDEKGRLRMKTEAEDKYPRATGLDAARQQEE